MWHNSRRVTQLGKFALWHNGRRATTQLGRFSLCGATDGHRATTQLDRFTLCGTAAAELHNSVDLLCARRPPSYYVYTTRYIYFVWHNGRRATQLGRFTLWYNGLYRAKQPGFTDACTRCRTHFPKTVTNRAEKYEGLVQSKILLSVLNALDDSTNTDR